MGPGVRFSIKIIIIAKKSRSFNGNVSGRIAIKFGRERSHYAKEDVHKATDCLLWLRSPVLASGCLSCLQVSAQDKGR